MNLAIRPELRSLRKISRILPMLALAAASCNFDPTPITAYKELEGCIKKTDSALMFQEYNFRQRRLTALENQINVDPGDRVRMEFYNTDTSNLITGRNKRRRQLEEEIEDIIKKSKIFVIGPSPKISIYVKVIEKTSPDCTG